MSVIFSERRFIPATPTLDTNAYASGDHMGTLMTLSGALTGVLESLVVLDKGKQSKGFTVYLFSAAPTIASADNAALDITDAEMEKCLGSFPVVTADYDAVANSSVASVKPNLPFAVSGAALYALLMADEAQTHGASDLVVKFGIRLG